VNFVDARHSRYAFVPGIRTADTLQALPTDLTADSTTHCDQPVNSPITFSIPQRSRPRTDDAAAPDPGPQIGVFHLLGIFGFRLLAVLFTSTLHWITQTPKSIAWRLRDS
jgi:hypothetical protein